MNWREFNDGIDQNLQEQIFVNGNNKQFAKNLKIC